MGTAVGLGAIDVAIVLALITMITLWLLSPLEETIAKGRGRYRRRA